MSIVYHENEQLFQLNTQNSTYAIVIFGDENFIGHAYYGRRIDNGRFAARLGLGEPPRAVPADGFDRVVFMESFPKEYPEKGLGDYKESAIAIRSESGHTALLLGYRGHRIYTGKPEITGLPASFGTEQECMTLELECFDALLNIKVILRYSVFEELDIITRSTVIVNESSETFHLTEALSASLDMTNDQYDVITVHGEWAQEGRINRYPLTLGKHGTASLCGRSGPQAQPFLALAEHRADQQHGEVCAMSLIYSGNFLAQAECLLPNAIRAVIGIHPDGFDWKLSPGECFFTPEAVLNYSVEGIGGMTRNFHDFYRKHLIRGEYRNKKRPILLNNWEATYFNFNTEKLLSIAKEAGRLGIEMLVMDDGWFGTRNDDSSSLGDWFVNEEKITGGLKNLVEEVNRLGLKFGIWMEPEMVSPDSNLFRNHPDWAIAVPGRKAGLRRCQYVLDLSRQEIVDAVFEMISTVLHSANIEYVKWDMNRQLAELGSLSLPADRQGELLHRYVLGVYQLQERLITEFPKLLLENCSSGGSRFDAGMLYYSPQIWASDDTDAVERLIIQEGTAMLYPLSAMGAHISDCPNHIVGRTVPFETRGYIALAGTFGYELDVTRIPEEDRSMIPGQVAMYHKYNDLVREGDYYRLASYSENKLYDCYIVVSKDKKEALLTYIQVLHAPGRLTRTIRLAGLEQKYSYRIEGEEGGGYSGEELMYAGLRIDMPWACGDYKGRLFHLTAE